MHKADIPESKKLLFLTKEYSRHILIRISVISGTGRKSVCLGGNLFSNSTTHAGAAISIQMIASLLFAKAPADKHLR